MAQVARAALALRQRERRPRPGGGQRRALGHALAAGLAEDEIRGLVQARRFRSSCVGVEEARRHAQMRGQRMDRRLGCLERDGGDAGDGERRESGLRQASSTSAITSSAGAPRSQPTPSDQWRG